MPPLTEAQVATIRRFAAMRKPGKPVRSCIAGGRLVYRCGKVEELIATEAEGDLEAIQDAAAVEFRKALKGVQ